MNSDPSAERSDRLSNTRTRIHCPCSKVSLSVCHSRSRAQAAGPRRSTTANGAFRARYTCRRQGASLYMRRSRMFWMIRMPTSMLAMAYLSPVTTHDAQPLILSARLERQCAKLRLSLPGCIAPLGTDGRGRTRVERVELRTALSGVRRAAACCRELQEESLRQCGPFDNPTAARDARDL